MEEQRTVTRKILRYIKTPDISPRAVRGISTIVLILASAIFGIDLVTLGFHTIHPVLFSFSIIISIALGVVGITGIVFCTNVSIYMAQLEDKKKQSFLTFIVGFLLVFVLAALTGCFTCILIVAICFLSGMIICLAWHWNFVRNIRTYVELPTVDDNTIGDKVLFSRPIPEKDTEFTHMEAKFTIEDDQSPETELELHSKTGNISDRSIPLVTKDDEWVGTPVEIQ